MVSIVINVHKNKSSVPKMYYNGTYHDIIKVETFEYFRVVAHKLQKSPHWPSGVLKWRYQYYMKYTVIVIYSI